jgi:hypothetical protein
MALFQGFRVSSSVLLHGIFVVAMTGVVIEIVTGMTMRRRIPT